MHLDGKKKWTATLLTLVASLLGGLVTSGIITAEASDSIVQLTGIVAPLAVGFVYNVMQGQQDKKKEETKKAEIERQTAELNASGARATSAQTMESTSQSKFPIPDWDLMAFDEQVKVKAPVKYGVQNSATELFTAQEMGQVTLAEHFEHVVAYWEYLEMKADARFTDKWGYCYQEAYDRRTEPGCPTAKTSCGGSSSLKHKALLLGEDYYTAYLDYERVASKIGDLYRLSQQVERGFNWKAKLSGNRQMLYWVGEYASELLRHV